MSRVGFLIRSGLRNRRRSVLTGLAVAIAILIYMVMVSLLVQLDHFLTAERAPRLVVRNSSSLELGLPAAYAARIQSLPGVSSVCGAYWFGGYYRDPRRGLVTLAVDPGSFSSTFPDYGVSRAALKRFEHARSAALAGDHLMQRFGWRVGDTITVSSALYPLSLTVKIVGAVPRVTEETLYLRRDYVDLVFPPSREQVSLFWARLAAGSSAIATAALIDNEFHNPAAETRSEPEQVFLSNLMAQMSGVKWVLRLVAMLIVPAAVLIAALATAASIRERTVEIAVIRALGFSRRQLAALLLAEVLVVVMAGAVVGMVGGWICINHVIAAIAPLRVLPAVFGWAGGTALIVGVAAAVVPCAAALSKSVVGGLRFAG